MIAKRPMRPTSRAWIFISGAQADAGRSPRLMLRQLRKDNVVIPVNADGIFKKGGEDLRVVIAHSTKNDLGERTASELRAALTNGVKVVKVGRVGTLRELLDLVQKAGEFDVLVLLIHGAEATNAAYFFNEVDADGKKRGLRAAEMALFEGLLRDKLCLFGVCHYGSDDLGTAVVEIAGALVCIAPKPGKTIHREEIVEGFGALLNKMQQQRGLDFGVDNLDLLLPALDKTFAQESEKLKDKLAVHRSV